MQLKHDVGSRLEQLELSIVANQAYHMTGGWEPCRPAVILTVDSSHLISAEVESGTLNQQ